NEFDRFSDELLHAREQLVQHIETDLELSTTGATVLATQELFQNAASDRDPVAILQIASGYFQRTGVPLQGTPGLQVYDAEGDLIVRVHDPLRGQQLIVPSEVGRVLDSGGTLGVVRQDEMLGPSIAGIAAITDDAGTV